MMRRRALYWEAREEGKVRCRLCPHNCLIAPGKKGLCGARENEDGELVASSYGRVASIALDPIEKKPLYHFRPGTAILSVGTSGCNMRCLFCQNYGLSQKRVPAEYLSPEKLFELIQNVDDNIGIAFTYNEPLIWYEYIYDAARLIKEKDASQVIALISNGYISPEPLEELLPYIDAMNIDLKAFKDETYRRLCGASLEPVLETIRRAAGRIHVEVTTLVITDENDSPAEIGAIASFLASIEKNIPLHLSRYFPAYKLTRPATSAQTLVSLRDEARRYLPYVYLGNVPGVDQSTYCPECGRKVIERGYYRARVLTGKPECPACAAPLPLVL
ncbi:MAG: AmmeMemoRadiSam system radical SAM enzyme [Bacilli bacterium]